MTQERGQKRLHQQSSKPVITYKSVSSRSSEAFSGWLTEAWEEYGIRDLVLVGSPSSSGDIKLPLPQAYEALKKSPHNFNLGGVTIAERHAKKGDEHLRLLKKSESGCEFFISQAVYNHQATADFNQPLCKNLQRERRNTKAHHFDFYTLW